MGYLQEGIKVEYIKKANMFFEVLRCFSDIVLYLAFCHSGDKKGNSEMSVKR